MQIRAIAMALSLVFLCSCQNIFRPDATEKRLAAIESSLAKIEKTQRQQQEALRALALQQRAIKNRLQTSQHRQKFDSSWIHYMRHWGDEDATKLDQMSFIVSKMIEPMRKMKAAIARLRIKIHQLRQGQNEIAQATPAVPKAPALAGPPVDKKKRKKVFESVAFAHAQAPSYA